ncbi:MAG: LCP family protein [Spirochaetaceae bacterium]|nr:LCP family protein [Spirochaetaceae bacterium]
MRVAGPRRGRAVTGVITGLIVIIATGAFVLSFVRLRSDAVSDLIDAQGRIAVTFMLPIDEPSPSFEVLMLDARTGRAALLFVPGSIGVVLPDPQRIGAIAALYGPDGHAALGGRLAELLDLQLDFYVDLSYEGLGRLVDVLGGVEVVIPDTIQILDAERRVLLPSGSVVLDGDMARAYLSYRTAEEPAAERVERVHRLMQGLLRSIADSPVVLSDPTAKRLLYDAVVTDLNRRAFDRLFATLVELDTDRISLLRVLGRVQEVDDRPLLFPYEEGALLRDSVKQTIAALSVPLDAGDGDVTPAVEVLNGTRTSGLAAQAATVFESFGYRVVAVDNADHPDYERTLFVGRRGDPEQARLVAALIQCEGDAAQAADRASAAAKAIAADRVITPDRAIAASSAAADVTVILGRDFNGRICQSR